MPDNQSNILRFLQVIALIVFCFAIGEAVSVLLTCAVYNIRPDELFKSLSDPANAERDLIILFLFLSSVFRFLVVPGVYFLFINKKALSFIWESDRMPFTRWLLIVALALSVIPCISLLIELNSNLVLPAWLSEVELYLRDSAAKSQQLTASFLSFRGLQGLIVTVFVVAVIPGIVEEIFFRGIVQAQLQDIFKNPHYAVFISATLFSIFHFQFYGFIPRMALGVLIGYIYVWSKNIWYPVIAHIVNNLIGVLGVYLIGPQIMNPISESSTSILLLIPSLVISTLIIRKLRTWNSPRKLEGVTSQ